MLRIEETLKHYKNKQFKWGEFDCCMFTCDCVKAFTGIDPAKEYRGRYDSELTAKKMLIKTGTIEETFDKLFNRVEQNYAKRGDVMLYKSDIGLTLGLVWSGGLLSMGAEGYGLVEEFEPIAIWGIL